jgi:tetratricopeptide (TPR) repeat protein
MKAEKRKEIETNSLVLAVQRLRKHTTGRTLYYLIGTAALVIGVILVWNYFAAESKRARDAMLLQLASADTTEKLKEGMEAHRGTIYGSLFKMQLARHLLLNEGLPRLGTDSSETRRQAAAAVEQARTYFIELTGELKEKDEPALVQEAWLGVAQAEEALVGLPAADNKSDSRGNVDKAIDYYEKAAAIFPDTEFSKRYKARAEKLKATKDLFVADQKAFYKEREFSPFSTPPVGPGKLQTPVPGLPSADTPIIPPTGPAPDAAKTPEPKPVEPPKGPDPKAK